MQNQFALDFLPLNANEQRAHNTAMACAGRYRACEKDLLNAIDEVDRLRLHEKFREASTFNYCINYLKLTESVAGYFCTVARKSRQLPDFRKAIEEGNIPVSKAAKICSVITPENQNEWIPKATDLSKDKLEKAVAEARPGKAKRDSAKPVAKNITRLSMDVSDEFLAKLKRVLDLEASRKNSSETKAEALEAAIDAYLKHNDPLQKAERAAARAGKSSAPVKVKDARAETTSDDIPTAVRHVVNLRDGCSCQVVMPNGEKCGSKRKTQVHRRVPRSSGGAHTPANLITLCAAHHRQWHDHDDIVRA